MKMGISGDGSKVHTGMANPVGSPSLPPRNQIQSILSCLTCQFIGRPLIPRSVLISWFRCFSGLVGSRVELK